MWGEKGSKKVIKKKRRYEYKEKKEGGKVEELKQALHDVLGADAKITVKTEEPITNKIELKIQRTTRCL